VLAVALAAFVAARRARHTLAWGLLPAREVLRRYARGRRYHQLGLIVFYSLALYAFGYGWAVHAFWASAAGPLPGVELLLLAPFCVALVLSWACFYDAERALAEWEAGERRAPVAAGDGDVVLLVRPAAERGFTTRWSYVAFHVRHNLALVFLPVLLLLAEKELRRQVPALSQQWQAQASLAGVLLALAVFVTMPWILRVLLGLRPLPPGALRDRLTAASRRLRFRCSDILLWNTRGGMANAMVVGVFPFLRYVMLSDRLVEEMRPEEVEAVFGHEVGHVKHHHMVYYLVFLLGSMTVLGMAALPYQEQIEAFFQLRGRGDLAVLPVVGSLAAYILLVFGFLSRRCERQADIYGCRAVSCGNAACDGGCDPAAGGTGVPPVGRPGLCPRGIRVFIRALEKVALLNGISRDRPGFLQSWQHSTIARRVGFLEGLLDDRRAERRFQRRVFLVKCGLLAALAALFLVQVI
jgi:STE24 endopeptidase